MGGAPFLPAFAKPRALARGSKATRVSAEALAEEDKLRRVKSDEEAQDTMGLLGYARLRRSEAPWSFTDKAMKISIDQEA